MRTPRIVTRHPISKPSPSYHVTEGLMLFIAALGAGTWAGTVHGSFAFALGVGFGGLVWLWWSRL